MGSDKPQFVIRAEEETLKKIKYIADKNKRSATKEIVFLIEKSIQKFEEENGEIKL